MQWGLILFFVGEGFVINYSTANALNLPASVVGLCMCSMGGDELISLGCRWDDPQEYPAFFCVVYLAQCVARVVQILSAKKYKVICCIAFPLRFFLASIKLANLCGTYVYYKVVFGFLHCVVRRSNGVVYLDAVVSGVQMLVPVGLLYMHRSA